MLTNGRVRSGKELLAYGFKKLGLGTIVGETTMGATLAGRLFVLSDGAILFLAVMDTRTDGERLERTRCDAGCRRAPRRALLGWCRPAVRPFRSRSS